MWLIILALLLVGLTLIIVEIIFVPGTTVVGILGCIFAISAIVVSYRQFGSETGHYVLIGTLVISGAALYYGFRSNSWSKFSLKSSINSRVNDGVVLNFKTGDIGITVSALRPYGKAQFNEQTVEVKTLSGFLNSGQPVVIKEINSNQIIVEPTNPS